jgi:hypothetical protein
MVFVGNFKLAGEYGQQHPSIHKEGHHQQGDRALISPKDAPNQ